MKKLLISIGLVLILATPAYATMDDTNAHSSFELEGLDIDPAGDTSPAGDQVQTANTSDASSILDQCAQWTSFDTEKSSEQKNSCEESISSQATLGNPNPTHELFNKNGSGDINGTSGCCYNNNYDKNFDKNNNCELDLASEKCEGELRALAIKKACICEVDPDHEICNQSPRCEAGNDRPTSYEAFESEFFDVTDPNKGLFANGQKGDLVAANNSQGPIFTVVNRALNIMVGLASTVALVVLIIGAYLLITAQGGENQMEKGKNAIIYSLLGLVFILTSYTIVRLVQSILF